MKTEAAETKATGTSTQPEENLSWPARNHHRQGRRSTSITPALRLLEERETKLAALRRALKEGESSGKADYSLQGLLDELDRDH